MRNAVKIKSFPNGIALYLNAELPFDKLLEEIGYKFSDARNFSVLLRWYCQSKGVR